MNLPAAATLPVVPATAPAGSMTATSTPVVTVTLTVAETLCGDAPRRTDRSLAQRPARLRRPRGGRTSNHPFLRVIFDVRSYANGGHRIDITVENCLDVATRTN